MGTEYAVHMRRGGDDRAGARPSVLVLVLVLVARRAQDLGDHLQHSLRQLPLLQVLRERQQALPDVVLVDLCSRFFLTLCGGPGRGPRAALT